MSEKILNTRIVHKHDTEENWLKATSFAPKNGELIIYDEDENHSYKRVKIGDGTTNVNTLPFIDANKMDKFGDVSGYGEDYITIDSGYSYVTQKSGRPILEGIDGVVLNATGNNIMLQTNSYGHVRLCQNLTDYSGTVPLRGLADIDGSDDTQAVNYGYIKDKYQDKIGSMSTDTDGNTLVTCVHGNLAFADEAGANKIALNATSGITLISNKNINLNNVLTVNTDGTITMGNTTLTEEKLIELINLKQYVDEMIGTIESQLAAI